MAEGSVKVGYFRVKPHQVTNRWGQWWWCMLNSCIQILKDSVDVTYRCFSSTKYPPWCPLAWKHLPLNPNWCFGSCLWCSYWLQTTMFVHLLYFRRLMLLNPSLSQETVDFPHSEFFLSLFLLISPTYNVVMVVELSFKNQPKSQNCCVFGHFFY